LNVLLLCPFFVTNIDGQDFSFLKWFHSQFLVRRKSQGVYCCAAVMLFCRVAVNFKTAAPQHRNTAAQSMTPNA
jgi:hypothetical protein